MELRSSLSLQYSTKEDKYEEEIKLLGEKLKEVRLLDARCSAPGTCIGSSKITSHPSALEAN